MNSRDLHESIDDYVERRIGEALSEYRVTDIQQLPLAALRRWNENLYQEFENDSPLETRLPLLTALPQGPQDGQVIAYDAGDGVTWRFRYNGGSASAYKWEYVGGSPLRANVDAQQTTTSTAYVDLATVGPSLTVPLAGDYDVRHGVWIGNSSGVNYSWQTVKFGSAAAADHYDAVFMSTGAAGFNELKMEREARYAGVAASTVLKCQYRVTAGTGYFADRRLAITPVRVG